MSDVDLSHSVSTAPWPTSDAGQAVPARRVTFPAWTTWLFRNPFFPFSAVLLIYGVRQLYLDPGFLGGVERPKLIFNFSALQLYAAMVVGVAILLARRKTWDDATFLVLLENVLVLAPFILLTQAIYLDKAFTALLCGLGLFLAGGRWLLLKRWVPDLNFGRTYGAVTGLILTANAALPFILIHFAREHSENWESPSLVAWWFVLPLLQSLFLWIEPTGSRRDIPIKHPLLPFVCFNLWTGGSAVHLWAVGYVSSLPLKPILLAPFLWTLAWTLARQVPRFMPDSPLWLHRGCLGLPILATAAALGEDHLAWFMILTGINLATYLALFHQSRNRLPLQLAWLSACAFLAAAADSWAGFWLIDLRGLGGIAAAAAIYLGVLAALERRYTWMAGAVLAMTLFPALAIEVHAGFLGLQSAMIFLMLWQLRWFDRLPPSLRRWQWPWGCAWVLQGLFWSQSGAFHASFFEMESALLLACSLLAWLIRGHGGPFVLPCAAVVGIVPNLQHRVWEMVRLWPAGLLAVLGAFVLFGAGTILAWNRHRWFPHAADDAEPPPLVAEKPNQP